MSPDKISSYVKNTREDYSTDSTDTDYSISKSNIPSYTKILVHNDGKEMAKEYDIYNLNMHFFFWGKTIEE